MCEKVKEGDRIESDGCYGTVRFVGRLTTEQSKLKDVIWAGVEWDDPSRGKHDGSYGGMRYFTTSPTGGSFLRLEKCNVGVDFMAALSARYSDPGADGEASNLQDMYVCGKNQHTAVTAVGLEKIKQRQSCFARLQTISLRGMFVRGAGKPGGIEPNAVNLMELDISQNLMVDWKQVAAIVSQMPCLKLLNVSESRLQLPSNDGANISSAFDHVRYLYINKMLYNWVEVSQLTAMFPSLEQLHACYNNISWIDSVPPNPFHRVTLINLEGNPITSWSGLLALGSLPQLATLIANDCGFSAILLPGNRCEPTDCFPAVTSLSVSGNQIADWSSIDELNRLKSLRSLRFARNPLILTVGTSDVRHIVVAKIARLSTYNGAEMLIYERLGAEIDYLRTNGQVWRAAGGSASGGIPNDEFINAHPRYLELLRKYGPPSEAEMALPVSSALKNNLVSIQIASSYSHQPIIRKLPVKMTVQKLRALVQRSFGICDSSSIHMFYIHPQSNSVGQELSEKENKGENGPVEKNTRVELDNDLRELSFYSLENDGKILVEW